MKDKAEKKFSKFDWPKEAVLQLIEMWRANECLYNPKNTFYHNKHARYAALNNIADKLKTFNESIGPNEVKNKLTYLRGQYTREVARAKERKSGGGAEDVYVPSVFWFSELNFLEDFVKVRKASCNLYEQNSEIDESTFESDIPSPSAPCKRSRASRDKPASNIDLTSEDSVLSAAASALQTIAANTEKSGNAKNEAFCKYLMTELDEITDQAINDELVKTITLAIFDAKAKQRFLSDKLKLYINKNAAIQKMHYFLK